MKKILIIEDDTDLCVNLMQIFELNEYKVFAAHNGIEGLGLAKGKKPDVILCDILMPGLNGYEVKERLGKDPTTIAIPFIFLTAKSEIKDIRFGLDLGADDYIIKPFEAEALLKTIENRLTRIKELKPACQNKKTKVKNPGNNIVKQRNSDQILVYVKGEPEIIKTDEIVVINSEGDYSNVICSDGREIVVRKLLKDWEKILPEKKFFRARKTTIINLGYIIKLEKWYSRTLLVKMKNLKNPVIVSQRMARVLKKSLGF